MQLSSAKFKTLSDIFRDIGQVFFASMFIGPLATKEKPNWPVIILGLVLATVSWYTSLILTKNNE